MKFLLLIPVLTGNSCIYSQPDDYRELGYNAGLNAIVCGFGAVVNKPHKQKFGPAFLKGMLHGAAGGSVIFMSKKLTGKVSEKKDIGYIWPAKIVNSIGVSMVENAASNLPPFSRYHLNFYFLRLDLQLKGKLQFQPKLLPVAFSFATFTYFTRELNLSKSLQYGHLTFTTPHNNYLRYAAYTTVNNIVFTDIVLEDYSVISHELIHTYQYNDFNVFNAFARRFKSKIESNSNLIKKIDKWVYWDFHFFIFVGLYRLDQYIHKLDQNIAKEHNAIFFEKEAIYYE